MPLRSDYYNKLLSNTLRLTLRVNRHRRQRRKTNELYLKDFVSSVCEKTENCVSLLCFILAVFFSVNRHVPSEILRELSLYHPSNNKGQGSRKKIISQSQATIHSPKISFHLKFKKNDKDKKLFLKIQRNSDADALYES